MSQPYLSLEAELHDGFWAAEDDASEVPLMAGFLRDHPGTALEIGCGSGRLLLPLLRQGFPVEGLELSGDMLALCRRRARTLGLAPVLHQADMEHWEGGPGRFRCVLAPAFTLQLAADPEAALRHWRDLLAEGGGLYLTTFVPFAELDGDLPENEWYEDHRALLADGRTAVMETRHRLDRRTKTLRREHRYHLSGDPPRAHVSRQALRWFDPTELIALLRNCGFEVVGTVVDFDPAVPLVDPETTDYDGILTLFCERSARIGRRAK